MRINIKPEMCKFVVNEEKRKVVCILEDTRYMAEEYYLQNMPSFFYENETVEIPDRFVGIATCSKDDEWDVSIGKRLAFLRMRKKFYNSFFKALNRMMTRIDSILERFVDESNQFGVKVEENLKREEEQLKGFLHE